MLFDKLMKFRDPDRVVKDGEYARVYMDVPSPGINKTVVNMHGAVIMDRATYIEMLRKLESKNPNKEELTQE